MFQEALEELFLQHRERITQVCGLKITDDAFQELYRMDLDPISIDEAITEELKIVLKKTHDFQISDRLNKYGWTSTHINDHMLRFFEKKMKNAANVLSLFIKKQSLQIPKEMISTLNDIHESDSENDDKYAAIHRIMKKSTKEL